jgi:hypothetical protein
MTYKGFYQWHRNGDPDMFFTVVEVTEDGYMYYVTDNSPHNSVSQWELFHFLTAGTDESEWIRRL